MVRRRSSSTEDGRKPRRADPATGRLAEERRVAAWIGQSIVIKGDLTSSEALTIAGRVEGDISVPEHRLIITPQAEILGNIVARLISVHGAVTGTITASEKIEIGETGSVDGDIAAPRMVISEGAILQGQVGVEASSARD